MGGSFRSRARPPLRFLPNSVNSLSRRFPISNDALAVCPSLFGAARVPYGLLHLKSKRCGSVHVHPVVPMFVSVSVFCLFLLCSPYSYFVLRVCVDLHICSVCDVMCLSVC